MRVLGITLGDERGIGPEVVFKALARSSRYEKDAVILIGKGRTIEDQARRQGWTNTIRPWPGRRQAGGGLWKLETSMESGAARSAIEALNHGSELALSGQIDGVVTGPVNKASILREGIPFTGQTEWLTVQAGNPSTGMMLLGTDQQGRWLRVLLATTHVPLSAVPGVLRRDGIERSIHLASRACRELGLETRRIAVCGLNPHAGEEGMLGSEEQEFIRPAIQEAQKKGIEVTGPWSGDTIFREAIQGRYDVVVAMYHDQGLAPLKLVAFETGVNWTVGLPYPRTSPDHGTAFDIAGRDLADPTSMNKAMELAWQLIEGRSEPSRPKP
jgi:4-hydroxythreonine-4-phosphate dehydrogenase